MADTLSSQGTVFTVFSADAQESLSSSYTAFVVYQVPAETEEVAALHSEYVVNKEAPSINVSQIEPMVVYRGRSQQPFLSAWKYTLDGHTFYVLRLGDEKTLVYDLSTKQWSWYSSYGLDVWRGICGFNWASPSNIAAEYGSNVVVGDDFFGTLWILNPKQGYDEHPTAGRDIKRFFLREATGQITSNSRVFQPVFQVFLEGSMGNAAKVDGSPNTVSLKYSDDAGNSYRDAGVVTVVEGDYNQNLAWRSLGLIKAPGRLFKITDDGALTRIDGMEVQYGNQ